MAELTGLDLQFFSLANLELAWILNCAWSLSFSDTLSTLYEKTQWLNYVKIKNKYKVCGVWFTVTSDNTCKVDNRSDEAMKQCDEAFKASSLQFLCQR